MNEMEPSANRTSKPGVGDQHKTCFRW